MMASIGQTSTPIQYSMRNLLTNQPLDFSTPSPPITHQPPEEILDLCVRRDQPSAVKTEFPSPPEPTQPLTHHPITILQQHLMQAVPRLPLREERTKSPGSPEYCSTSSERSEPSRMSPQNLGLLVAGLQQYPMLPALPQILNTNSRSKPTRPFKAYPKDPLTLSVGVSSADSFLGQGSNEAYSEFRRRMLDQVQSSNNGTNSNKARSNMKRPLSPEPPTSSDAYNANGIPSSPEEGKDAAYWERRRKNNEAAKRSRDARRHKEDEIAIRAAFLEQENMKLKYELAAMRNETAKLRCLLYNS